MGFCNPIGLGRENIMWKFVCMCMFVWMWVCVCVCVTYEEAKESSRNRFVTTIKMNWLALLFCLRCRWLQSPFTMILENHQYHASSHTDALSTSRLAQLSKRRDKHNSVHMVTFYLALKKYSCNSGFFFDIRTSLS